MIESVEKEFNIGVQYLHKEHYETYARLQINEAQEHYDPADHLIISHAICNKMPLISDDRKFPFYRNDMIEKINLENLESICGTSASEKPGCSVCVSG